VHFATLQALELIRSCLKSSESFPSHLFEKNSSIFCLVFRWDEEKSPALYNHFVEYKLAIGVK